MEHLKNTSPTQILVCTDEATCNIDVYQTTKDSEDSNPSSLTNVDVENAEGHNNGGGKDVDNEKGNGYDESQPPLSSGPPQEDDSDSNAMRKSSRTKNFKKKKNETTHDTIIQIHSEHDLDQLLHSKSAFVLVEFVTTWCGACKSIQSLYEELAAAATPLPFNKEEDDDNDTTDEAERFLTCAQVTCDKNKQTKKLALKHRVTSYPVFLLFEFGKQIDRWDGADRGKLMNVFDKMDRTNGKKTKKNKKKK